MKKPQIPENEKQRQTVLDSLEVIDSQEEKIFDQLTLLASQICGSRISLISLIDKDRQWFKSRVGLEARETPRDISFCGHVVAENQPLIVSDSRLDDRFSDNPLVVGDPSVIFYAGIPLIYEGFTLGTLCVIDSQPKLLSEQQLTALNMLADQVVAQLKLRKELKRSKDLLKQVEQYSAQVPGVIYQFQFFPDGRSCFPFASDSIYSVYEVHPKDVQWDASVVFSRLHPDDLEIVSTEIKESAFRLLPWSQEYRVILPVKGERWLRGFAQPERLEDGSVLWHGFITDITEEKKLHASLQQNMKLSALGEMAGGIAHEINNPLAIISGNMDLIRSLLSRPNIDLVKIEKHLESVDRTIIRIVKIIKGLKAFSRNADHDEHKVVELSSIFEDTFAMVQEKFRSSGVNFEFNSGAGLHIKCNSTQISQALMNLLNNAFDAIRDRPKPWIKVNVSKQHNSINIEVIDSGLGIPPEVARKIMQPFYTTKPIGQGTGLGLSVSKGLIERHNGQLLYNEGSKNTSFSIILPLEIEVLKAG